MNNEIHIDALLPVEFLLFTLEHGGLLNTDHSGAHSACNYHPIKCEL